MRATAGFYLLWRGEIVSLERFTTTQLFYTDSGFPNDENPLHG